MKMNDNASVDHDGSAGVGPHTRAGLHQAIDSVAGQAQPMADRLATGAHSGLDRIADTLGGVSQALGERGKQAGAKYRQLAESGRGYVRTRPAISVLVAVAAGYGLSKLIGPRR